MAKQLSLENIRMHTVIYMHRMNLSRAELSDIIGVSKSSLTRFINTGAGLQSLFLINLINLLYYDN